MPLQWTTLSFLPRGRKAPTTAPTKAARSASRRPSIGERAAFFSTETSLWEKRVVATEGGSAGRALRTSSAGKHDEASEAVRRTRASGEAEAKQESTIATLLGSNPALLAKELAGLKALLPSIDETAITRIVEKTEQPGFNPRQLEEEVGNVVSAVKVAGQK